MSGLPLDPRVDIGLTPWSDAPSSGTSASSTRSTGVELYRDRTGEEWPRPEDGEGVAMFTRRLDLASLLAEAQ